MVSFCEAVYDGEKKVEGVTAKLVHSPEEITLAWREDKIPLLVDPKAGIRNALKLDVLVDAILAKRNLGTSIKDASLVIGLGPGFTAGKDVHAVIETNRGHNLGRMILTGGAEPNTGIPGEIAGFTAERVFRAPRAGKFLNVKEIGARAIGGGGSGGYPVPLQQVRDCGAALSLPKTDRRIFLCILCANRVRRSSKEAGCLGDLC